MSHQWYIFENRIVSEQSWGSLFPAVKGKTESQAEKIVPGDPMGTTEESEERSPGAKVKR
jgi:hypothetical protein